ncbi:hypothetical protein EYF80_017780 [Liparis tanakae]|uniref:Uncharacterized protein n=1 Tax=Liparis tanakae TaxID=230148 RepID=A0A4Z2I402_9TELE|nr:hypothetical protein EYF80_017780 [Liparis tanakae]
MCCPQTPALTSTLLEIIQVVKHYTQNFMTGMQPPAGGSAASLRTEARGVNYTNATKPEECVVTCCPRSRCSGPPFCRLILLFSS